MYLYKELLMNLVQEIPHAYSKQTRRYHFAGMFCEMMAALNKQIPEHERSDVNRNRSIIIARDFIQMVHIVQCHIMQTAYSIVPNIYVL